MKEPTTWMTRDLVLEYFLKAKGYFLGNNMSKEASSNACKMETGNGLLQSAVFVQIGPVMGYARHIATQGFA